MIKLSVCVHAYSNHGGDNFVGKYLRSVYVFLSYGQKVAK